MSLPCNEGSAIMTSPVALLRHCNNYKPDWRVFAKKGQVGVSCPFLQRVG